MDEAPRTLLALLVAEGDRSQEEHVEALISLARDLTESRATFSPRQFSRWLSGEVDNPRAATRRVLERHFGYSFRVLIGPPKLNDVQTYQRPQQSTTNTLHIDPLEAATLMAAYESSEHAASVSGGVEPVSIEQVRVTAHALAYQYHELSPVQLLMRAKLNRDLTYKLLERTRRPAQMQELYLVAALSCGMLSLGSFDLGFYDAAEEHARSCRTYADLSGHRSALAWAHGTHALVAFWRNQPRRAIEIIGLGVAQSPDGKQLARLMGIAARARALLGDAQGVVSEILAADRAMDNARGDDELADEIGGELGWGPSLHNACAGTALLVVGDGDKAAQRVRAAIAALPLDPNANLVPERAQIDLAGSELLAGNLNEAEAALDPIWSMPVEFRRQGFTGRMEHTASLLVSPRWRDDPAARLLRDQVEAFNADAHAYRALTAS